ncbi:rRNA methyltransferase [Pseudoxanthomonas jiangsuensis]|uniref:TrmH family RNA methyltransferase n=1 Tax=Pseudoxanthomonas jiangsuensis TaxID=619688 RepID=UPI001391609B|nr:TrmH family RNA methyltransferase [Pseudoxanthomonas jiangsuensis]KAF1698709.1 rRNA methyltransferase [Pseudoxanthomonas jiangsuensis]
MAGPWDRGPRPPRDGAPPRGRPRPEAASGPRGDARRADPAGESRPRPSAAERGPASPYRGREGERGQDRGRDRDTTPGATQADAAPARPAHRDEVRLYGLNAVQAVFARRPQAIRKLYLLQSRIHALRSLLAWCVQHRVGYRVVDEADLERLAASAHHEGVVADVLKVEPAPLADWLAASPAAAPTLAIWLDGVGNPHNFGAILRSAAHFGAAVLLPAGSPLALSGAAARVAEGGAEAVPLVRLPESGAALAQLRAAGFGLAATVVRDGEDLFAAPLPARLVYVMGAEGEGMDAALAAACDARLSIPGSGAVESLNVAAATAVFLAQWAARRAV